jgi:hypothetical protein
MFIKKRRLKPGSCDVMAYLGAGRSYHVLAVASKNLKIITLKPMQDQTEDTGKKNKKNRSKN